MYQIQDAGHDRIRKWWRTFRKAADKLIEKLLCRYLEMKGVSTRLDEGMEEGEREKGSVWVPVVCESGNQHCSLSRTFDFSWSGNSKRNVDDSLVCFFAVDVVRHLEMQRIVGFVQRWFARPCNKNLERTSSHPAGSWQVMGLPF